MESVRYRIPSRSVMVTAYATPDLERRAAGAGIDRVLSKPCLPQTIMREISRTLGRSASRLQA